MYESEEFHQADLRALQDHQEARDHVCDLQESEAQTETGLNVLKENH
jgi:hypothetical protein